MNIEHYILIGSAFISLIGVGVSFLSVRKMGKQVEIQKKQWEYSCIPVFRISYITNFDSKSISLVIDNPNQVYHQIEKITFSDSGVSIKEFWEGTVTSKTSKNGVVHEREDYPGLIVTLLPTSEENFIGAMQIVGMDMLGNRFKVNSNDMVFKNYQLENHLKISKTYLRKI